MWRNMRGRGSRQSQFTLDRRQQRGVQRTVLNDIRDDEFDAEGAPAVSCKLFFTSQCGKFQLDPPRRARGRFTGGSRGAANRGGHANRYARGEPRAQWNEIKVRCCEVIDAS